MTGLPGLGLRAGALAAIGVLCLAAAASAAPGFITESNVTSGAVFIEITVGFRCRVQYLGHDPDAATDIVRVRIEPTTICSGASPSVAATRQLFRPPGADDTVLDSIEYDGESPGAEYLRFNFTRDVRFDVRPAAGGDALVVRAFTAARETAMTAAGHANRVSRNVQHDPQAPTRYVINLQSSRQRPDATAVPERVIAAGTSVFVSEVEIDGRTWFRLRNGYFASAEAAARALASVREQFPDAWIDRASGTSAASVRTIVPLAPSAVAEFPAAATESGRGAAAAPGASAAVPADDEAAALMSDARRAMTAGELSRAIQIYTKILQLPANASQQDAQEFLALARERNGQLAHAKAEYERYLESYPDGDGAARVRQRLAALLAAPAAAATTAARRTSRDPARKPPGAWKLRTFWSQFYRRDVNQLNDQQEIVSQSSLYTDASFDARRRGERFDFTARVTAGYRNDLLGDEGAGGGNDFRLSYAYVDLADAASHLRGRLGRQTRNAGGVLGRFDGINLGYGIGDHTTIEAVLGQPVYSISTNDALDRRFYGLSATFAPFDNGFDVGVFYLAQDIEGMTDRQAVGAEMRYFGENRSLWGMFEYDPAFAEIGSAFVQASWRLPGDFTLTGLFDRRYSPYLMLGNALIGQPSQSFGDLAAVFSEEEIRQLAIDRSAPITTVTFGVSRPLSPKLQLSVNATRSAIGATTGSAGVEPVPASDYTYYSVDLVGSSLFLQGDVAILSLRQSSTGPTDVISISIDTRIPLGRSWRISPRLRVDRREIIADGSEEFIYTPELRLQYRMSQRARFEFDAGREFASRDMNDIAQSIDRESYFLNLGYQLFF